MNQPKYPVKKNEELNLSIEGVAFGGKGFSRVENYMVFVKNTLPGDRIRARIYRRKQNYAEARLLDIDEPSALRIDAPCAYFSQCGGCTWQNLSYQDQLMIKRQHVAESLQHIGAIEEVEVEQTMPSPSIWGYRNKMEFSFSDRRWLMPAELGEDDIDRSFALGLHIPGTFDKILDIDHCMLQSETANEILKRIDLYCKQNQLAPYGIKSHEGYLRFLVIRQSFYTGEILVNLVTSAHKPKKLMPLIKELKKTVPEFACFVNTINSGKAQVATGEEEHILHGAGYIEEKLGEFVFRISANSFFQTNTLQAERLYHIVLDFASLSGSEVVWDLFCGTGTIALYLASKAKQVTGFEIIISAVQDARKNASTHGITNVKFVEGDLLDNISKSLPVPDVVVVDPPRAGMHPGVCRFLSTCAASRIVYVSCNPTTLARDLQIMCESYKTVNIQPVDMFPHTYHIETVVLLERR